MVFFITINSRAALYEIIEVSVPSEIENLGNYNEVYGVAIIPSVKGGNLGCFAISCNPEEFALAAETRVTPDGYSYREESPFGMDRSFNYIQEYSDFKNYCHRELLYSTCDIWASNHWISWNNELVGDTVSNALAFIENGNFDNKFNNIINRLTFSGEAIGNQSIAGGTRNTIVSPILPNGSAELGNWKQGRAWAIDSTNTYAVGSIAREEFNENGSHHTSKAAVWKSRENPVELQWQSGIANYGGLLAQGSMRDIVLNDGYIYGVGYNAYGSGNYYNASIFRVLEVDYTKPSSWKSIIIPNARSKINGNFVHSNSVATAINNNLVVIGVAKRSGSKPENGAANNRLFIVNNASESNPSAIFLSGGIFFNSAGGKAGAINNYNEIVGQLDFEDTREKGGKPRRKRAFIYPYNTHGTNFTRADIFNNQAHFLDDLTNGDSINTPPGISSKNNAYRIVDATDINDAGVIAGTALRCTSLNGEIKEYDDSTHNSHCTQGVERLVAVKLIPIFNATNSDIQSRMLESESRRVERNAGSLGCFSLFILALVNYNLYIYRKREKHGNN
ncbi:DUF3466 family protein [Candidatus Photodesmus blepharus]|nr:DUF3466 family protein [Candidatus Photodesmus blepharus]